MNPVAGQSADFTPLARLIAAQRMQKAQNQVSQLPIAQAAQGYMADFQPENPNQHFQAGQAAAYSPTPLAAGPKMAHGADIMFGLAAKLFNPKTDKMLTSDIKDLKPLIGRFLAHKGEPSYSINQLPKDESVLRQVAGNYIDDKFATKDPLENVAQELLNRLHVDMRRSRIRK